MISKRVMMPPRSPHSSKTIRTTSGGLVLALVLVAAPAHAVDWSQVVWASSCAADWTITYVGVSQYGPAQRLPGQHYFAETNRSIAWLQDQPAAMVGVGAGLDAVTWFALRPLVRHKPRLARAIFVGLAAYRGVLVAQGLRNLQQASQPLSVQH